MNGFNPNVRVGANGEAEMVDRDVEAQEPTTEERILALNPAEREQLLQDALYAYSDLESLIHAITRLETPEQGRLF